MVLNDAIIWGGDQTIAIKFLINEVLKFDAKHENIANGHPRHVL